MIESKLRHARHLRHCCYPLIAHSKADGPQQIPELPRSDSHLSLARVVLFILPSQALSMLFSSQHLRRSSYFFRLGLVLLLPKVLSDHTPVPLPFSTYCNGCQACSIMKPFCNRFCLTAILLLPVKKTKDWDPGLLSPESNWIRCNSVWSQSSALLVLLPRHLPRTY
jgi:hypothetical protein